MDHCNLVETPVRCWRQCRVLSSVKFGSAVSAPSPIFRFLVADLGRGDIIQRRYDPDVTCSVWVSGRQAVLPKRLQDLTEGCCMYLLKAIRMAPSLPCYWYNATILPRLVEAWVGPYSISVPSFHLPGWQRFFVFCIAASKTRSFGWLNVSTSTFERTDIGHNVRTSSRLCIMYCNNIGYYVSQRSAVPSIRTVMSGTTMG